MDDTSEPSITSTHFMITSLRRNAIMNMPSLATLIVLSFTAIHVNGAFVPTAGLRQSSAFLPILSKRLISSLTMSKTDKELVCIPTVNNEKFDSLSTYIVEWSKLLENDPKGMGLTTPVTVSTSDATPDGDVAAVSGVKILFLKTKTGDAYKSKEEERATEEDEEEEIPEKEVREGGVEVLVEQLNDGHVQVRARRCEVDEDTTIKEMSEENITSELTKAVDVFMKEPK